MKDNSTDTEITREAVYNALRGVIDPEVGINIVELGLVYDVVADSDRVEVSMTLTSPACPMGAHLADESRQAIQAIVPASVVVDVRLAWEPPWNPEMMSDEAKQLLGWK
ncbi:metal-sulfur cluster assembly factor [Sedimenticola selenatireducens]|uniref:Metal-sulfur cluster assembly factor n=1 Tax=Sedimenticola selenatireducens TaxID=191960 RepID=A0A2N6CYD1_9GAMM|nr:metal-sulfur cluster assembly factor [Sedimenticola selenatireducens]PLX62358.1 MAG: metal-sulfur cluster assembly factor [Sedimenticola selenatireducens]